MEVLNQKMVGGGGTGFVVKEMLRRFLVVTFFIQEIPTFASLTTTLNAINTCLSKYLAERCNIVLLDPGTEGDYYVM